MYTAIKVVGGIIVVTLFLWGLHRLCLWLESRGWLNYRSGSQRIGGGTAIGNALQELNAAFDPGVRYEIQMKQEELRQEDQSGDPPSKMDEDEDQDQIDPVTNEDVFQRGPPPGNSRPEI